MRRLLILGTMLAGLVGCGSSSPVGCGTGTACIQGLSGQVCAATCTPDAGTPCPSGQTCQQHSSCCTGTACAATVQSVCCPAAGC